MPGSLSLHATARVSDVGSEGHCSTNAAPGGAVLVQGRDLGAVPSDQHIIPSSNFIEKFSSIVLFLKLKP